MYVGSLYLPAKASDLAGVLAKGPRRIQMNLLRDLSADQLVDALNDGLKDNNTEAELAAVKAQQTQLTSIMKSFGEVKEGNVVTLDFVDDAHRRRPQRRREGDDSGRGVQPRADEDLARRQAHSGRPQEGDAGRLIGRRRPPHAGFLALLRLSAADGRAPTAGSSSPTTSCARLLLRPELAPIPESCAAELALHEKLIAAPRAAVARERACIDRRRRRARELRHLAAIPRPDRRCAVARGRLRHAVSRRRRRAAAPRAPADRDPAAAHPRRRRRIRSRRRAAEMLFRTQKIAVTAGRRRDGRRSRHRRIAGLDRRVRQPGRAPAAEPHAAAHDRSRHARHRQRGRLLGPRRAARSRDQPEPRPSRARCALPRAGEMDRAHAGRGRDDPPAERDRRQAVGLARRPRCRGERAR